MALQRIFTPEYVNQLVNDIHPENYQGDNIVYNENEVRRLKGVEQPEGLLDRMLNASDEQIPVPDAKDVLFSRNFADGVLSQKGTLIYRVNE